jgi:hypothetical protein
MGVYANSLSKRPAITVREVTKLPSTRICARLIVKWVKLSRSAAKYALISSRLKAPAGLCSL